MAQVLLSGGAQVDTVGSGVTAMHLAASGGHQALARVLLDGGADVDAVAKSTGGTSLHLACHHGSHEITSMLLERGAAVDALDNYGNTPAMLAGRMGHEQISSLLRGTQ